MQQSVIPSHEEHNQRQREYYAGPPKRNMVPRRSRYLERHVERLVRFGPILPGQRVLEIGCGMGRYTLPLAERGVKVEGMDLSDLLLDRLREYNDGRFQIPLHCGDILHPAEAMLGAYDAVVGLFVLHHIDDLDECFASIAKVLKPGGKAVFVEPNPYNPLYYVQMAIKPGMTWQGDKGMLRMRRKVLFGAMQKAGFVRPAMRRFGFFPPMVTDRTWGAWLEGGFERFPLWRPCLPFQLFKAEKEE